MTANGGSRTRRLVFRALHGGAEVVRRTPARRVLDSPALTRARLAAGREMPAGLVLAVVDALADAGVPCWLVGGWAVDALVGEQTRPHGDLDVMVDGRRPQVEEHAAAALTGLRLPRVATESSVPPLSLRWVHSDGAGHTVDLLPADVSRPPFGPDGLTEGMVGGRSVPCIAAPALLALRTGYTPTAVDRRDVALLCERFGLARPAGYPGG